MAQGVPAQLVHGGRGCLHDRVTGSLPFNTTVHCYAVRCCVRDETSFSSGIWGRAVGQVHSLTAAIGSSPKPVRIGMPRPRAVNMC